MTHFSNSEVALAVSLEDLFAAKVFFLKRDASDLLSLGFKSSHFSDWLSFHGEGLFLCAYMHVVSLILDEGKITLLLINENIFNCGSQTAAYTVTAKKSCTQMLFCLISSKIKSKPTKNKIFFSERNN